MKKLLSLFMLMSAAVVSALSPEEIYERSQNRTGAIQNWYEKGVPHTDRNGGKLNEYTPGKSFFPIGMWGVPKHDEGGEYDWGKLAELGVNTVWLFPNTKADVSILEDGRKHGYQVIFMGEMEDDLLKKIAGHPNLLGNVWKDEPIGKAEYPDIMKKWMEQYLAYKAKAARLTPGMLVFINDAAWIMPPATEWFVRWNTAGDVACHDNYPIKVSSSNSQSSGLVPNGISQSTIMTIEANEQRKPLWVIIGAFDQGYPEAGGKDPSPFRYPTPEQLRNQVYTAIIHGATGIHYFIWDSYISRLGRVFGMSPEPQIKPDGFREETASRAMTPMQRVSSYAMWTTVKYINMELNELAPVLLSPTVPAAERPYKVENTFVAGEKINENPVRAILKRIPGSDDLMLISCNMDAVCLDTRISFERPLEKAEVLFGSYLHPVELAEDGLSFSLRYEPFNAHVIRLKFKKAEGK